LEYLIPDESAVLIESRTKSKQTTINNSLENLARLKYWGMVPTNQNCIHKSRDIGHH
jgi:hypothetical protein